MASLLTPLAVVLLLMGLPLTLLGLRFRASIAGFNRRAVATTGRVVACREHTRTSQAFWQKVYFPEVEFVAADGRSYRVSGLGHRAPVPHGTMIQFLHDPENPQEVSFTGPRGQAGIARTLLVMGILCLAGGGAAALASALPRLL